MAEQVLIRTQSLSNPVERPETQETVQFQTDRIVRCNNSDRTALQLSVEAAGQNYFGSLLVSRVLIFIHPSRIHSAC